MGKITDERTAAYAGGGIDATRDLADPAGDAAGDAGLAGAVGGDTTAHRPAPADPEAGTVVGGKYRLTERIGEGGMGSVWAATQTEPVKRKVAVKLIKAGMDSKQVLARFEAERQALAVMDHPNIARVLDGGVHAGRPYFVMELVKGVPVTQFCDERKLTPAQRLELFVPVCQAIQHAHQKGVIHRDVKPSNVLVALYDDRPVPKVIDFGVAKATGAALTEHTLETGFGAVVGTPQYMSPEQASLNNLDVDTRSDVYSLGVLLYELLTGSPPFTRKDLEKKGLLEILRVVREEEPPRPSVKLSTAETLASVAAVRGTEPRKLAGLLRSELDWIVMKALEKDRSRRYDSANGFAADVQRYLAGEPVQAHPPSAGYRLKKFARKHRGPLVAGSLVLVALLGGIVGTTGGLLRADERRREAEQARTDEATQRGIAEENEREAKRAKEKAERAATAEKKAKEDAEAKRKQAEKARDRTRAVLDAMTSVDASDLLAMQQTLTADQRKFFTEVLAYYREFSTEGGDDERSRSQQGQAALRVGQIEMRLGHPKEAEISFRRGREVFTALAADFPDNPVYRRDLVACHNDLAYVFSRAERRADAEAELGAARKLIEKLTADFPEVTEHRRDLGRVLNNCGYELARLDKSADAAELFRNAASVQEKLAADFPKDPGYHFELGRTLNNLAIQLEALGKWEDADKQFRAALDQLTPLVAGSPNVPEYYQELALTLSNYGSLLFNSGRAKDGEEHVRQAVKVWQTLQAAFRGVPEYRLHLAGTRHTLGGMLRQRGRREDAEAELKAALAGQAELVADFPAVAVYRWEQARSHNTLALLYFDAEKWPAAAEQHRKALAIQEKLATDFPDVTGYRRELGYSLNNLAILLSAHGDRDEAEKLFRRTLTVREKLVEQFPDAPGFRQEVATVHNNLGLLFHNQRKGEASEKEYRAALAVREKLVADFPDIVSYRGSLAITHVNLASLLADAGKLTDSIGHYDQAFALLDKLPPTSAEAGKLWADFAPSCYKFATVCALAGTKVEGKSVEYSDRAMDLLTKAVKAGFRDAAHIRQNKNLDPLRERDDFKRLLADLEKKMPPKPETPQEPKK